MSNTTQYATCLYHSARWAELVEDGWVTATVNILGIATMVKQ